MEMAGVPQVRFTADSTLLGHATLRFPGRELVHTPSDGPWRFAIYLYRLEQDTLLITQLEGTRQVGLEVLTRRHRAREFRAP